MQQLAGAEDGKMPAPKSRLPFFAHSTDKGDWQALRDHLTSVSALAAERGAKFGAGNAAGLAGLLHDLGKYTKGFQRRLSGGPSVDHASAGARHLCGLLKGGQDQLMAELIAYAIAGHHTGLPDKEGGEGCLSDRLKKELEPCDLQWQSEIAPDASGLLPALNWVKEKCPFQFSVLGRMIFSCLIDADRRDTEGFYAKVEGRDVDRSWAALPEIVCGLIDRLDLFTNAKAKDGPVNALRAGIRFIPAHAGNTVRHEGPLAAKPVHPRACGEHPRVNDL